MFWTSHGLWSFERFNHYKAFNIVKNLKYDGYQRGLASIAYTFFDKKTFESGIKNENISNKELTEELHKRVIRKFNKKKKITLTF